MPGKEYENYHVEGDGTVKMTALTMAGQPVPVDDDGDGVFATETPGTQGVPEPKGGVGGGIDEDKGGESTGIGVSSSTESDVSTDAITDDDTTDAASEEGTQDEVPENAGGDQ